MDEHRDEIRFEQVAPRGVSRAVPIVTFLIGIFIGAAVVKPWDIIFPPSAQPTDRGSLVVAAASATPAPKANPSPTPATSVGPAECAFAGGWRIFALGERDRLGGDGSTTSSPDPSEPGTNFSDVGNPLRRWLEIVPLDSVSGPGDVRIPFVTIVSSRITGIGFCPPPGGEDGPPIGAQFEAWSIDGTGGATPVFLQPVTIRGTATEIEVYIGSRDDAGGGRWAPARYVFAVASPDGSYGRWFGLDLRTPPGKPTS